MSVSDIAFVIRAVSGTSWRGEVRGVDSRLVTSCPPGGSVSLNVVPDQIQSYSRDGNDLLVTLVDGRVIVIEGFFSSGPEGESHLFLSSDGTINEVIFVDDEAGLLVAQYGPTEVWGTTPYEDLIFFDKPSAWVSDVSGFHDLSGSLLLTAGVAAAGIAAIMTGGGDGSNARIQPTVDDPDAVIRVGGGEARVLPISGTAAAGSLVTVTIDGVSVTATAGNDQVWSLNFSGATFPDDGSYLDVSVAVTEPDRTATILDGPTFLIDTAPPVLVIEDGAVSTGDVFNAVAYGAGVTVSGLAEVGSTVTIALGNIREVMVVGGDGRWSFEFDEAQMPAGDYVRNFTLTATDSFGNSTVVQDAVRIDTVPSPLAINPVTGDDLVNGAEAAKGFAVTGTSAPGTTVTVSFAGRTLDVLTGPDGVWSMPFGAGVLQGGEYVDTVTARTLDASGNALSATSSVKVDTVTEVALRNAPLTGDDLINATELAAGFSLQGTSQPGSTVLLSFGGVSWAATVAADGSWTANVGVVPRPAALSFSPSGAYSAPALPVGTYDTTVRITATDTAGNIASTSHDFIVDTEKRVTINTSTVETDGTVNAAERADGILITGQTEPGASVVLTVEGAKFNATVDAAGIWSVILPANVCPEGVFSLPLMATATDLAGNVATVSGAVRVDTETSVSLDMRRVEGDGIVNAVERADGVTLTGEAEPGASVQVTLGAISQTVRATANGSWAASFAASEIPSGERVLTATAVATDVAGNTASSTGTLTVDTLVRNFASTLAPGGADRIVNAAEASQGINFGGTSEPGSKVVVTLAGVQNTAIVAADGNWTVSFGPGQLPSGELTSTLTAVATDLAGNTESITQTVRFDTNAGLLTIASDPVEIDDVINFKEASDGVVLTGTSSPGQIVLVTLGGVTHSVQTDSAGAWRAPFTASEVAPGTYVASISATITDTSGNTLTRTDSVRVDTEVVTFAITGAPIEGDGIVNSIEAADGVRLSGTIELGSTVEVLFRGALYTPIVNAAGVWSVVFPAGALPSGETTAPIVVNTTDPAGNVAQLSSRLTIDTEVNRLSLDSGLFTSDGVLNAREVDQGLTLTGKVEAGSALVVTLGGVAHVASVDVAGNWTVGISAGSIPQGVMTTSMVITATDAAGNTRSMTESVLIDTEVPDAPVWLNYTRSGKGTTAITTDTFAQDVDIACVIPKNGDFVVSPVNVSTSIDFSDGSTLHVFSGAVSDGCHLVVSYTNSANNMAGTLLVSDDPATNLVTLTSGLAQALSAYQVEVIDLQFAEDTELVLGEAQILALSGTTDEVVVLGGSDDSVTILGATKTGMASFDGQDFNVFELGDATILIDDDITNVNFGVV